MPVLLQQKLLEHFVAGTTARAAALLVGVQTNTAKLFYQRLRQLIASKQESYLLAGEIEADESDFGGVRKGRRGRGAAGKVPVFGLLKRGGKVGEFKWSLQHIHCWPIGASGQTPLQAFSNSAFYEAWH